MPATVSPIARRGSRTLRLRGLAGGIATLPITLAGLVAVTFVIGRVMPIDPVIAIVGDHAPPEVVARVRQQLGLDHPLVVQLGLYVWRLLHGNLGTSVLSGHSVVHDIGVFFPATIELATAAMVVALAIGIPAGVYAAARPGGAFDQSVRVFCLGGQSVPVFVIGLVALLVFYVWLGWAPGVGEEGVLYQETVPRITGMLVVDAALGGQWGAFWDALDHLAMPALVLAAFTLATITRMTRAFMLDALAGEYVITARAKGLSPTRILWRHAFRNIAVGLVTVLALAYAGLLEGAVLTESIFSWPGLGQYLTTSLLNADLNAVLGATLVIGASYVLLNLLADLAARALDPRAR